MTYIIVNWEGSPNLDKINIYRATYKFDRDTLPSLLVEILPTSTRYMDLDVELGEVYYYMVEKVKGKMKSYSPLISKYFTNDFGHGPENIIKGDWESGYFGEVSDQDFMTPTQFITKVQDVIGRRLKGTGYADELLRPTARWQKFIYKDKVLFISLYGIVNNGFSTSWKVLYEAGLVYGIDGNGTVPSNCIATNQNVVIEHDGARYKVRLLRFTNNEQGERSNISTINNVTQHASDCTGSEFYSTWMSLFFKPKKAWASKQVANFSGMGSTLYRFHVMELMASGLHSIRHIANGNVVDNYDTHDVSGLFDTSRGSTWIPVLELVN